MIKIEDINNELPLIWSRLNFPLDEIETIPDLNRSPSDMSWHSLLSDEAINKIKSKYHEDFELLGY